jgi:transcriptional regulator with XRE-family HTH domain
LGLVHCYACKRDNKTGNSPKVRKTKGFTQEQLVEKISTSTPWIGHIETGRELPNVKMLQKIARALRVKVKDLIPY